MQHRNYINREVLVMEYALLRETETDCASITSTKEVGFFSGLCMFVC